jgi:hypothetical protein
VKSFAYLALSLCIVGFAAGCGDDQTATTAASETMTTTTATETSDPATDSASVTSAPTEDSPTTGDNNAFCEQAVYPVPGAPFDAVGPELHQKMRQEICDSLNPGLDLLTIHIYRPDPLPNGPYHLS